MSYKGLNVYSRLVNYYRSNGLLASLSNSSALQLPFLLYVSELGCRAQEPQGTQSPQASIFSIVF